MAFKFKKYGNQMLRYIGGGHENASKALSLKQVTDNETLDDFLNFPLDLYRNNPYYVPLLKNDERDTLLPEKNPAHEYCETAYFLVYRGENVVGRIAGIINHFSNEKWHQNRVRFGFVDFIDDDQVVDLLFNAVEDWGRAHGCKEIHGPLGFTDLDREGMLIEGFDQLGTITAIYNYPYYPVQMDRLGYLKDTDWQEYKIYPPKIVPDRHRRVSDVVRKRFGLTTVHFDKASEIKRLYGNQIFELINVAYSNLYGTTELTDKQIEYYVNMYMPMVNPDMISIVVRETDRSLVGFGIALPSLSRALQKAWGNLLPFGIIYLLKALKSKKIDIMDLMLIAVHPEFQGKGVNALIFEDLIPVANQYQVKFVESNPELEDNMNVQMQWNGFKRVHHKLRRCYVKTL